MDIDDKSDSAERTEQATDIVGRLPKARPEGFDERWSELRAFKAVLRARTPRAWMTPALVVANVLVFLACVYASAGGWTLDPQALTRWGSNAGLLVMSGEWQRLFSAMFLHGDLLHLLLNMWALWGVGRLVERLYGTTAFVFIYLVSGVFAGLASIGWNPYQNSVGASGAIFALLGALVVFLSRASSRVPRKIVLAHGISAIVFILYSAAVGVLSDKIDNAAHIGGLISGSVLGWLLARPFDADTPARFTFGQLSAAGVTALLALGLGIGQVHALRSNQSAVQRYWADHQWLLTGQNEAMRVAADLQARASAGTISETEFLIIMERQLLPFWKDADTRLPVEAPVKDEEQRQFAALVAEYVRLRHEAVRAGYEGVKNRDRKQLLDSRTFGGQADAALTKVSRLEMRAQADRLRSWSQATPVTKLRYALAGIHWKCATPLKSTGPAPWKPSANDGAAGKIAGGCNAQRAFETGDYAALDAMFHPAPTAFADMLDGDSRLAGVVGGLQDLFQQRQSLDDALSRLAEWRRERPGSDGPDLVQSMLFRSSAWAARGGGLAKDVSPQQFAIFQQHLAMAQAALQDADRGPESSPVWYQLGLLIGLDGRRTKNELRATFDAGHARYPDFYALHTGMLRVLMPRWKGSLEEMDDFIEEMVRSDGERGEELYARLYTTYAALEGDELNMFQSGFARWSRMEEGYRRLMSRHPESEFLRNSYAAFACRAGDRETYHDAKRAIRTVVPGAWTEAFSVESCDEKLQ